MEWYYAEAGQQRGPVSEPEFQDLIRSGKITGETLVWRDGMANWQRYRDVLAPSGAAPPATAAASAAVPASADARQAALDKVNGPAIGLIVTASFGIVGALWALTTFIFNRNQISALPAELASNPDVKQALDIIGPWLGVITLADVLLMLALSALILVAGLRMKNLRSRGLAIAGSVASILPCISIGCAPCCVLGLPIGIWALVVLNKPEVKSQFQ